MDTTEQYIKMCDCPEIQGEWKPKEGDYCAKSGNRGLYLDYPIISITKNGHLSRGTYLKNEFILRIDAIWLPRQDQIQGMLPYNLSFIDALQIMVANFWVFTEPVQFIATGSWVKHEEYLKQFNSMEQLWLAFYMHEKHGKVWDGEKWAETGHE